MTREAMERALIDLPERSAGLLAGAKPHLLSLADDIPEEILGIMCASPHLNGNSALVVTPNRIVEVTTGGAMQVLPYAELASVRFAPGKKKRFGGHQESYLLVDSLQGGTRTYPLFRDHEWNLRVGSAAEAACRKARLRAT